jgi:inner membrane protein
MKYKTHIATSVTLAAGVSKIFSIPFTVGYLVGVTLGSLLPDIDEPNSYIGRRSFGIAHLINRKFGHRGFTHSLLCWLIVTVYCLILPSLFTIGISFGYLFHIIGDLFSVQGVPLFSPIRETRQKLPSFITYRTSSVAELYILISLLLVMICIILDERLIRELINSIVNLISVIFNQLHDTLN